MNSFKSSVGQDAERIWYFLLFSLINNILILVSTSLYVSLLYDVSTISYKYVDNKIKSPIALCIFSILINIGVIVAVISNIKTKEPNSTELLHIVEFTTFVNMLLYFIIDSTILKSTTKLLTDSRFVKKQDDTQEKYDCEKSLVINLKKDSAFARFNVDFACLLGITLVIIIQAEMMEALNDTDKVYAFSSGGILIQIIITQIIFVLFQSKRLTNK